MLKTKWICCLEKDDSFLGKQYEIFDSQPIFYDEYYETLTGVEICKKCLATYLSFNAIEFSIPKIYFHIPISKENYDIFLLKNVIKKNDILLAKEKNKILIEREINNKSIWEWQIVDNTFLDNI